ncbi:MAG: exodeoxyribonuclease VII large subunit [Holosporales bacterium]|jgi:exodeoxyribonuclease VII large subunit|nr:exodeoxyribonuclease VII large subunit [Holosporales bacterium]
MHQAHALAKSLHILGDEDIFTVSELSRAIKDEVERNFTAIKLRGEVSGLKKHSSGHTYLSIKDDESVINAICWRGTRMSFQIEEGMEVIVKGRVTTYHARSQYQFVIEEASVAGEGTLLKIINERKKLFTARGYFDIDKKLPIPKFPQIIGIVTSKTGAVISDMQHRLNDRYPFCHVIIWPVNVQGANSAEQIATAVRGFNLMTYKRPDVLIVARGGGSVEDLWSFNEEIIVRAVFESKIPVISAIGHETDTTLIDYAADLRAPTPTAAIEFATPVLAEVKNALSNNSLRLETVMSRIVNERRSYLSSLRKRLSLLSQSMIISVNQRFDDKVLRFATSAASFMGKRAIALQSKRLASLDNYLAVKKQVCASSVNKLATLLETYANRQIEKANALFNRLDQGSFKSILKKGFCFVTDKLGRTVGTREMFERERANGVTLRFVDGSIDL